MNKSITSHSTGGPVSIPPADSGGNVGKEGLTLHPYNYLTDMHKDYVNGGKVSTEPSSRKGRTLSVEKGTAQNSDFSRGFTTSR